MKRFLKKNTTILIFNFCFLFLVFKSNSQALTFNPNNIISDYDMQNSQSMNVLDIQSFLDSKGYLGRMMFENYFGELSTTAEIIYKYSQQFNISPKYLITTLQKEQSLIEKPLDKITQKDLDWAMGFGVCDDCSKSDPAIQKFKGFDNQIYHAARRNRDYYNSPNMFSIQTGKTSLIDNKQITPENQATTNLYIYTPHLHGNENFFTIWNRYFSKNYPNGTLLAVKDEPTIWLVQYGIIRPFLSFDALSTRYNPDNIIYISKQDLGNYEKGNPIKYANYSILKAKENGNIYLLDNFLLKPITSLSTLKKFNFDKRIITASLNDFGMYDIGENIEETTKYPTGAILEDSKTKELWFVKNNNKYKLNQEIYNIKYKNLSIIKVKSEELNSLNQGMDDSLPDGILVTGADKSRVFIISDGERREVSISSINNLGLNKDKIITVSDDTLVLSPIGFPLEKGF